MQENWAQLPADRIFGAVIKVQVDRSDGKSIWVFDRCAARECTNSMLPPLLCLSVEENARLQNWAIRQITSGGAWDYSCIIRQS